MFTDTNQKQGKAAYDYPTEFHTLRDKDMFFKLEINQKNVDQMSDDKKIIDEFKKK